MGTRRVGLAGAAALALTAAGCGSSTFANEPRPPEPINVGVSILNHEVSASPQRFGAGGVEFDVANQTDRPQRIAVKRKGAADDRALVSSGPINPDVTAVLQVTLHPGTYVIKAGRSGVRSAILHVGPRRASAQNQLLQP